MSNPNNKFSDRHHLEVLENVFSTSIADRDAAEVPSYRADHEDWIPILLRLENEQFLCQENNIYRVTLCGISHLKSDIAKAILSNCEKIFNVLRHHYKNKNTRKEKKLIADIAKDTKLSFDETVDCLKYFLDSPSGTGHSTILNDAHESYLQPTEAILTYKTFDDLLQQVQRWCGPRTPLQWAGSAESSNATTAQLNPWSVICALLFDLTSDEIIKITSSSGLTVDWEIAVPQSYSSATRKRAYRPKIDRAYSKLPNDKQLIVAQNVANELTTLGETAADNLKSALARIGWKLSSGMLTTEDKNAREMFFPKGTPHDAYVEIRNIIGATTKSITIVDPYLDSMIFQLLKTLPMDAKMNLRFLTSKLPPDFGLEAKKFAAQFPAFFLEIRTTKEFHDRFIIVDDTRCYHIGASLKDAGDKAFMISRIEDPNNLKSLIKQQQGSWSVAKPFDY